MSDLTPCLTCRGSEWVCEEHPGKAWNLPGGCDCSPGAPCPACSPLADPESVPALEPSTLPNQPLTAAEASCFIEKEIG